MKRRIEVEKKDQTKPSGMSKYAKKLAWRRRNMNGMPLPLRTYGG